jgi:hypothetical protein
VSEKRDREEEEEGGNQSLSEILGTSHTHKRLRLLRPTKASTAIDDILFSITDLHTEA